jgi:protein-disulfide isomerase
MHVAVVEVRDCPHAAEAARRVADALHLVGRGQIQVDRVVVTTVQDAERLGAPGSPTILIDGRDLYPSPRPATRDGLVCRLYPTPTGLSGAPTVDQLVQALSALEDR